MKDAAILKTGVVGSVIAAICCVTPVLVIALGTVGLSLWLGWVDYVLLPALAVFLADRLWPLATATHSGLLRSGNHQGKRLK